MRNMIACIVFLNNSFGKIPPLLMTYGNSNMGSKIFKQENRYTLVESFELCLNLVGRHVIFYWTPMFYWRKYKNFLMTVLLITKIWKMIQPIKLWINQAPFQTDKGGSAWVHCTHTQEILFVMEYIKIPQTGGVKYVGVKLESSLQVEMIIP